MKSKTDLEDEITEARLKRREERQEIPLKKAGSETEWRIPRFLKGYLVFAAVFIFINISNNGTGFALFASVFVIAPLITWVLWLLDKKFSSRR